MPIYEYYCRGCDFKFELLKSIKENQSAECPKCNRPAERQISLPGGLVFKGSGFYITDYNKKNAKIVGETDKNKKETKETLVSTNTGTQENKTSIASDKK
jgi:putative FmdB family regulatory protein